MWKSITYEKRHGERWFILEGCRVVVQCGVKDCGYEYYGGEEAVEREKVGLHFEECDWNDTLLFKWKGLYAWDKKDATRQDFAGDKITSCPFIERWCDTIHKKYNIIERLSNQRAWDHDTPNKGSCGESSLNDMVFR